MPAPEMPVTPSRSAMRKHVTYIGLSKQTMLTLVELYTRFKDHAEIYGDGMLEAVLSAYGILVKLKYGCPVPSKFGNDVPLWKTATTCFLRIVMKCVAALLRLWEAVSNTWVEAIWRQIINGFRGGILADCSLVETFSLEEQEMEENFDLALISSLEIDLIPHLGGPHVLDYLIGQLAKILHQGSQLYKFPFHTPRSSSLGLEDWSNVGSSRNSREEFEKLDLESVRSTVTEEVVPREWFSYWYFDLLFLICSNVTNGAYQETSRRRVAALCLPSLLDRCKIAMVGYIADEALRGSPPFPRVHEDELLYVLRKLLDL
ncbi:hypothetical protein HD554DRAFT_2177996 [Boletus coccyginus]|nr:hypothetical protein HD554DRAFT_2177996 [Boletus coccyginus]